MCVVQRHIPHKSGQAAEATHRVAQPLRTLTRPPYRWRSRLAYFRRWRRDIIPFTQVAYAKTRQLADPMPVMGSVR